MSSIKHVLTLFIVVSLVSCSDKGVTTAARQWPIEVPLITNDTRQVITHKGFTLSYNADARISEWVAYELTSDETDGADTRRWNFLPDPDAKGVQADNDDYRHSGWDKGHLAPAGDMKWDSIARRESFYFTNICPQNHNLNSGLWNRLEMKCRSWAKQYGKVYVVTGPIIGQNKNGTIGYNKVVVPDAFFKVVMTTDQNNYHSIGFIVDNRAVKETLSNLCVTVDSIEAVTGLDFFWSLPDSIEKPMEQQYDLDFWLHNYKN